MTDRRALDLLGGGILPIYTFTVTLSLQNHDQKRGWGKGERKECGE
jgi:hypothetical protein